MTASGAFDHAVQEATHVTHIALPSDISPKTMETDILIADIKDITSILESIIKGPRIKSAVTTSSFVVAFEPKCGFRPGSLQREQHGNPIGKISTHSL